MNAPRSPSRASAGRSEVHRPRRALRFATALALLVLVSACTEPTASPSSIPAPTVALIEPTPADSGSAPEDASPEPSLDPDPIALFTCGATPPFVGALLTQPTGAETSADPAAAALRALLEQEAANAPEGAESFFPASGWWRVGRLGTTAAYVARSEVSDFGFVSATLTLADGEWRPSQWGECTPQPALPAGLGLAAWRIDGEAPRNDATTISALVTEMACASGESSEGRILPPEISYGPDAIHVVFAVQGMEGEQTCQGNPSVPYTIELREPIGERSVLDGSQLPPRDATTCPSVEFECDRP
jgi:hypothetical protein